MICSSESEGDRGPRKRALQSDFEFGLKGTGSGELFFALKYMES